MEPFLGIMLDMQPRPTHLALRSVFQNLYKQIMEPTLGLQFCSIKRRALPALSDDFFREYKKEWMESFAKCLEQYDSKKLESAVWLLMKQLAAMLSRQRGIQYEFGPQYNKYLAQKAAGILGETLSEIFTEDQRREYRLVW